MRVIRGAGIESDAELAHGGLHQLLRPHLSRLDALPAPQAAAQLVACECVVLAETKDHSNWELLGRVAEKATGDVGKTLKAAYKDVEQDEDHHLYHSAGWCRELWIESLGMPAVLPPLSSSEGSRTNHAMLRAIARTNHVAMPAPSARKGRHQR